MSSAAWSKTNPLTRRAVVLGSLNVSAGFDAAATATSGQSQMATCKVCYTCFGVFVCSCLFGLLVDYFYFYFCEFSTF